MFLLRLNQRLLHLAKTGCQWHCLSEYFVPWSAVYHYFRQGEAQRTLAIDPRTLALGRGPQEMSCDGGDHRTKSFKSSEMSRERRYDTGTEIDHRKRDVLADTSDLILRVLPLRWMVERIWLVEPLLSVKSRLRTAGQFGHNPHLSRHNSPHAHSLLVIEAISQTDSLATPFAGGAEEIYRLIKTCMRFVLSMLTLLTLSACGNRDLSTSSNTVPQFLFTQSTIDLGEVKQNAEVEHIFVLENTTDSDGVIIDFKTSCSCTQSRTNLVGAILPSGAKLDIPVLISTDRRSGPFSADISVLVRSEGNVYRTKAAAYLHAKSAFEYEPKKIDLGGLTPGELGSRRVLFTSNGVE